MNTAEKIQKTLQKKLSASKVEVLDQSSLHTGHKQSQLSGGGHYSVVIIAEIFKDKRPIERHRMVYQALAKELRQEIHALAIQAYSSEEYTPKLRQNK